MNTTKQRKSVKSKTSGARMKDLKPAKNPKGGSQKKEDPSLGQSGLQP